MTSSQKIASQAAKLRNQGRDPELDWLQHVEAGFSYRLSDINCALGISQLKRIEDVIARRQTLAESYDRELMAVTDVRRPATKRNVGRISWFVYPVQLTKEFTRADRDAVCASMLRKELPPADILRRCTCNQCSSLRRGAAHLSFDCPTRNSWLIESSLCRSLIS